MEIKIKKQYFRSIEDGTVAIPLYDEPQASNPDWIRMNKAEIVEKNIQYVQNYIGELLQEHFKTLQMWEKKIKKKIVC